MNIHKTIFEKVEEINSLLDKLDFQRSCSDGSTIVRPKDYYLREDDFHFLKCFKKMKKTNKIGEN